MTKRNNKRKVVSDDEEEHSTKKQKVEVKAKEKKKSPEKKQSPERKSSPEKKGSPEKKSSPQKKSSPEKKTSPEKKESKPEKKENGKDKGKGKEKEETASEEVKVAEGAKAEANGVEAKIVLPVAPPVDVIVVGSGEIGQLGLGKEVLEKKKPALIPSLKNKRIAKMAVGGLHVALLIEHDDDPSKTSLYTWGCNDQSILGRETPSSDNDDDDDLSMSPGVVPELEGKHIVDVTTGEYHMAALDNQGKVYLWGTYKDQEGFLGFTLDQKTIQATPVIHPGLKGRSVKQIASGYNHTIILTEQGKVYLWGFSWIGRRTCNRLKRRNLLPSIIHFPPHSHPPRIKAVFAGGYHNFVLTEDDKVFVWGLNNGGQLGLNDRIDRAVPIENTLLRNLGIIELAGGQHHSLALTEDGRVYSFGRGDYGQLGHGDAEDSLVPRQIAPFVNAGDKVVKLGCGDGHSMAITANGILYTWGFGERLQLGTQEDEDKNVPTHIPFNSYDIVAGGGGGQHSTFLGRKKEAA